MVLSGPADKLRTRSSWETDSGSDEGGYKPEEKIYNTGQRSNGGEPEEFNAIECVNDCAKR